MSHKRLFKISALCSVLVYTAQGLAANPTLENTTNFFDPGRISNQLQQKTLYTPAVTPKPQFAKEPGTIPQGSKIHFVLRDVKFVGNTVFTTKELETVFASSLNHDITLSALQAKVHAITVKYREAGYILSRAFLPPQVIRKGSVTVQIVEGFVSKVAVQGDPGKAKPLLEAYGKHVMQSKPLKFQDLERYALLANDLPGYTIKSVLTPSATTPGGADLTLVVDRRKASGLVSYDNYGTRYIGPLETTVSASLYSIFTGGDLNSGRFTVTSKTKQLHFAELIHDQPVGTQGLRWQLGSDYAETRPGFILTPADIIGRNFLLFTTFNYPWLRERNKNLMLYTRANYQNVTATILGGPFYQDRIRSLVLGGLFDNIDSYHGINTVGLNATHGFPIFGAHDHFYQSRPDGQASYTRLNLNISRLQALNTRWSIFGAIQGQYSFQPLLATEQFGFGGPDFGRGYDPSEIVGDKGAAGKVELRLDTSPSWRFLNAIEYYAFVDAGIIRNISTVGQPAQQSAISTGVGARITFLPQVSGNLFLGKPLTRSVATLDALDRNGTAARIFFQITASI